MFDILEKTSQIAAFKKVEEGPDLLKLGLLSILESEKRAFRFLFSSFLKYQGSHRPHILNIGSFNGLKEFQGKAFYDFRN